MAKLTEEQQYIRMTETPVSRLVTSLAIPTVAGMLVSSVYNITDTFFVSQLGTSASAAVGVVFSIQSLIQAVGFSIAMGSGSMVSRRLGQKDSESASKFVSSAFAMAFVFGTLLRVFGLLFLEPMLGLIGSTDTMMPHSVAYARYILAVAPIFAASFVLNVAMKSQGNATLSMMGMAAGNVLNMILDPVFIFGLKMGTAGAALAPAISLCQCCGTAVVFFEEAGHPAHPVDAYQPGCARLYHHCPGGFAHPVPSGLWQYCLCTAEQPGHAVRRCGGGGHVHCKPGVQRGSLHSGGHRTGLPAGGRLQLRCQAPRPGEGGLPLHRNAGNGGSGAVYRSAGTFCPSVDGAFPEG